MLLLRHDAVHVVVAHLQPVGSCLAVRSGIGSRGTCQTVECVIPVHVVVAHLQPVGSCLAVRSGIGSRGTCQTVECVIRIGMRHLSARLSAFGNCGLVGNAEHVAYGIVGIAIVHDGLAACVDRHIPSYV